MNPLTSVKGTVVSGFVLAILVGTDYNPGGVKGIGPKTAMKLVNEHANNFDVLFKEVKWEEHYPDLEWREVFNTIKEMKVSDDYNLEWNNFDEEKLIKLLVDGHDFSLDRVKSKLAKIKDKKEELSQKGLGSFF